jgi:hypothetical protein
VFVCFYAFFHTSAQLKEYINLTVLYLFLMQCDYFLIHNHINYSQSNGRIVVNDE